MSLPGAAIAVAEGTDCTEHLYAGAVVEVQDFVVGAHVATETPEAQESVDQD